jgi:hypothetical protein
VAAPVKTFVQLPLDTGNTGKKIQTQQEVIGADTVLAHYFIQRSAKKIVSRWGFVSALTSVQASAHANNTGGFLWIPVPIGASVRCRLRKLALQITMATEVDHLTAPRIVVTRFTFTGAPAGATLGQSRVAVSAPTGGAADAAPVASVRTAITGMTCTYETGYFWSAMVPSFGLTTSGIFFADSRQILDPNDEEEFLDFGPGEGLVIWQPDAGTATDGRRFVITGRFDEYDNA